MTAEFLRCYRRLYSGSGLPRLRRRAPLAALLTVALGSGGCSMSYQLESMFGDSGTTGSISQRSLTKGSETLPPEHDLAYAKAAASEVLMACSNDMPRFYPRKA